MAFLINKRAVGVRACLLALAVALSACGGGDDDDAAAAPTPVPTPAPTPAPNPVNALSTGLEQSGVLNYVVYAADGSSRNMKAVVAYAAPSGKVTFEADTADAFEVSTTNGWASASWPSGLAGATKANGNIGFVCGGGGQVGVSHNMVPVADHAVLRGLSFTRMNCRDGQVVNMPTSSVFNADGTVLSESGATMSAAQVDSMFSTAGLELGGNANIKLRLFKYTAGGVTNYHIVRLYDDRLTTNSQRSATVMSNS